jgi:hypothetical protein
MRKSLTTALALGLRITLLFFRWLGGGGRHLFKGVCAQILLAGLRNFNTSREMARILLKMAWLLP